MAPFGLGPAEMMIVMMFLGGFGLPMGVPPQAENPAMSHVAPAKCVFYASWAGMAEPDPESGNHTEQLLAEPEVQQFAQALEKSLRSALDRMAAGDRDPKAAQLAKLGPAWARTVLTHNCAVFASRLEVQDNKPMIEGGVLIDGGEDAAALADGLVRLLSTEKMRAEQVMLGKVKFQRFAALPEGLGELTIGAAGNFVMIGVGKGSVEGMVDRLKARQTPAWLTDLQKRLAVERRASMSYVNVKALVDSFLPLAGPEGSRMAESLGLMQIGQWESVTGLDKEGMISRGFVKIDGKPKGLLTLLDGQGIKPEEVDFLPRDATIATAISLDAQQVYDVVAQFIEENAPRGPGQVEEVATMFENTFGLRLQEDLLASLGNVWTISLSPADGWLGFVATVEVLDRTKLEQLFQQIQDMLAGDERAPKLENSTFGKHQIYSLSLRAMPIRPAWCITDSRLIVGLSASTVKSALTLKANETGLFSRPELAAALKGNGTTIAVAYQDTAKVFEATYSYLSLVLPMMADRPGGPGFGGGGFGLGQQEPWFDLASLPSSRSIHRHLRPSVSVTRRTKTGVETEVRQTFPTPNLGTSGPVAVALLLPAVQAAREAGRRSSSSNNLKQIMLALHNHHDTYRAFPPAYSTDKEGKKPQLSWRVAILPFIEQQALYNEFHLDEPWDSEHNKALIAKMPDVFKSPQSSAGEGKTVYLGVAGDKGIFAPPKEATETHSGGLSFRTVTDGTSNTIAIVEANDESAVIWTKPDDYTPNEEDPLKGLLGMYPNGFNVGLCDGSVRFVSQAVKPQVLMNLFQRNDGNPIGDY